MELNLIKLNNKVLLLIKKKLLYYFFYQQKSIFGLSWLNICRMNVFAKKRFSKILLSQKEFNILLSRFTDLCKNKKYLY